MTDEHWRLAWKAYTAAAELRPEEQPSFLAAFAMPPEVLDQVTSMLEEAEAPPLDPPPPEPGWRTGARIGRYEIGELLGSGGVGEVYAADDCELSRRIAIKFLNGAMAAGGERVAGLMREAKAASALNHPNIITVYELIRAEQDVAIAMELVEGHSLRQFCGKGKPQGIAQVMSWGRQIAQALAAAHQRKIIHRDIKPENLMVRDDGILKVLDFGIADQWDSEYKRSSGRSFRLGGTLNYMSPEQARGEQAGGASDVFSLGIVLYELATGTHPFRSAAVEDTLHAIAHLEPHAPSSFNRKIPGRLDDLLLRMLNKDPAERPAAVEVEQQLSFPASSERARVARLFRWAIAALTLIAIAAAVTSIVRDRFFKENEPQFVQLTRQVNENRVTAAAISPGGKTLLFATLSGAIYQRRMSDGFTQPFNLPSGLRVDRVAWFNDESRFLLEGSMTGAGQQYEPGIWVMPLAGGQAEQVATGAKGGVPSPDGSRIAFTSADGSLLSIVSQAGGNRREIRSGADTTWFRSLVWSPDAKRIAFQRVEYLPTPNLVLNPKAFLALDASRHEYESVDVDSGRSIASLQNFIMESACGLSDGTILFLRNTADKSLVYDLWRVNTDPQTGKLMSDARQLTHQDYKLRQISSSRDGKELVAVRDVDSHPNIYVADLPPKPEYPRFAKIRRLTFADADEYPHAWSLDSRSVIFESSRNSNFDLFRQDIDQSEAQPLLLSDRYKALPRITPDGKWIFYNELTSGNHWNVMGFPMGGGPPKSLLPNQPVQGEFACALGAVGRCVARTIQNGQFVFSNLDAVHGKGSDLAKTAWSPAIVADWDISPDGSLVAIPNHDARKATIRLVPLAARQGTAEKVVNIKTLKNLSGVVWAADGKGWYVAVADAARGVLYYVDLDGRVRTNLMESMTATYAVPSPDGRHVAFADWTVSANVWEIR